MSVSGTTTSVPYVNRLTPKPITGTKPKKMYTHTGRGVLELVTTVETTGVKRTVVTAEHNADAHVCTTYTAAVAPVFIHTTLVPLHVPFWNAKEAVPFTGVSSPYTRVVITLVPATHVVPTSIPATRTPSVGMTKTLGTNPYPTQIAAALSGKFTRLHTVVVPRKDTNEGFGGGGAVRGGGD